MAENFKPFGPFAPVGRALSAIFFEYFLRTVAARYWPLGPATAMGDYNAESLASASASGHSLGNKKRSACSSGGTRLPANAVAVRTKSPALDSKGSCLASEGSKGSTWWGAW